ncbi:hypothetical protein [Polaromonas sp.]|uniref:hypothetical protein n=1 Tax=Polaromonas sp. TaxID=1869339 RepID=UPI003BB7F66E
MTIKTNRNGLRKPRQPYVPRTSGFTNTGFTSLRSALLGATGLVEQEIQDTMVPVLMAEKALREGVATELQFQVLESTCLIMEHIEKSGIVRGLREHIASAQAALQAVTSRARSTGAWKPPALHYAELDAVHNVMDLHEFQLRQLSAGELSRIVQKLIATVQSSGGEVLRVPAEELAGLGLHAAT